MDPRMEKIDAACRYIKERIGGQTPLAGIVLGSGQGKLAELISDAVVIPYKEVPGFLVSTAIGHKGNLVFGRFGGKPVLVMQGRFHYYEGYSTPEMTLPIRVLSQLGAKYLFVTNAAGGLHLTFRVGDLMIIGDHINMLPNPLIGPNFDEFGPRFPDMSTAYDRQLIDLASRTAVENGFVLKEGVYLANSGPSYETPAEVRFYRSIGADSVGMSTVSEVIVARHCGLRVMGISVITNVSNDKSGAAVMNDGEDVLVQANKATEKVITLYQKVLEKL